MSTEEEVERKKSNQNERTILDILTRTLSKDSPTRYLSPDASAAALEIPPLEVLGEGASVLAFSSGAAFLRRILLVSFFFLFHLSRNEMKKANSPLRLLLSASSCTPPPLIDPLPSMVDVSLRISFDFYLSVALCEEPTNSPARGDS